MAYKTYEHMLSDIYWSGSIKSDRTGTGTRSLFGMQFKHDLRDGMSFPLITSKKVHFKSVAEELIWMLRGSTNVKDLQAKGVTIWDEWANEDGELGPVYGHQWRSFGAWAGDVSGVDQISQVLQSLRENPFSRRHIVTAWNPLEVDDMALPPCHMMFQFNVRENNYLSTSKRTLDVQVYQRSADMFLGVPFNLASYGLLLIMFARQLDMIAGELNWVGGDCHIYNNHLEQCKLQLTRWETEGVRPLPWLNLNENVESIFDYEYSDIKLEDYNPYSAIKGDVSI